MAQGFDAPPTLERSGSEHRRAWEWVKDPPAGEGQVGQKNTSLAKEKQAESKKTVFEFPTNFSKRKKQKSEAS